MVLLPPLTSPIFVGVFIQWRWSRANNAEYTVDKDNIYNCLATSETMTISEDGSHDGIMSERTLNIAGRIYAELQSMIHSHGDEVNR